MRYDVVSDGVPAVSIPGERRHAVGPKKPQPVGDIAAVRDHQSAFADGQVLVAEEREAADVADGANPARRAGDALRDRCNVLPTAWQASSIKAMPRGEHSSVSSASLAGYPP